MIRKSLNKFNGYLLAAIFIAVYAIMTQIYTILAKEPFWLDEFFIIYNLKLRPLKFLTEELAYNQQFPRIYFYIIQLFSKVFNFSYISLRLIPFLIQCASILLLFHMLNRKIYSKSKVKLLLFLVIILSNKITVFYFTQVKQYSMEFFCALLAIYQLYIFKRMTLDNNISYLYILGVGIFLAAPFFSYTYIICATPVILFLIVSYLNSDKTKTAFIRYLLPVLLCIFALLLNYFSDLRFILADKNAKTYWNHLFVDYSSINLFLEKILNSAYRYFGMLFVTSAHKTSFLSLLFKSITLINIAIIFLGITKCCNIIMAGIKKHGFKNYISFYIKDSLLSLYFLLLMCLIWILYLTGMLPVGAYRLNYFALPMLAFFYIEGIYLVNQININVFRNLFKCTIPFCLIFFILFVFTTYYYDIKGRYTYDKRAYDNYGQAINEAYIKNAAIAVLEEAVLWHHKMIMQTHPNYNINKAIDIQVVPDRTKLMYSKENIILIDKYKYDFIPKGSQYLY